MALEHYVVNDNFNIEISESQTLSLFDNISPRNNQTYEVGSWWLERYFSNQIYECQYNAHTPENLDNLKIKNKVYSYILKIKDEYLNRFDRKKLELGIDEDTLGIQIRGTDKKQELPEIQIQSIFNSIDKVDKQKIFVATDDKYYLDGLLNRYGERVVYDNSLQISSGSESINHNCLNRSQINEEVLSSVYLLSNCSHFLYSFSNVSLLTLIMGVNNFQFVDYLNK